MLSSQSTNLPLSSSLFHLLPLVKKRVYFTSWTSFKPMPFSIPSATLLKVIISFTKLQQAWHGHIPTCINPVSSCRQYDKALRTLPSPWWSSSLIVSKPTSYISFTCFQDKLKTFSEAPKVSCLVFPSFLTTVCSVFHLSLNSFPFSWSR